MAMRCSAREKAAIHTYATDRRHQKKVRRRLIDLMEEYPEKVRCWLESYPKHEFRDIALRYQRQAARNAG
ncbi:MAG: hypothetical protein AB1411_16010 [Nitrospirota bacterium]